MSKASGAKENIIKSLKRLDNGDASETSDAALANLVNDGFLSPMKDFQPLTGKPTFDPNLPSESTLVVSAASVFEKLSAINPTKAQGPDGIPGWLLKENADLLADPVQDILNTSYQEGRLPSTWKEADIIPIPKQRPIFDINKHLRPISLTPLLSKLAEEYVVEMFVKPAVLAKIDTQQFGTIPNSSTVHALIDMIHSWLNSTDGNGATTRVVLFDYRKAFDLIDHTILVRKLCKYSIPSQVLNWIVDFLQDRKQRVKLGQDCLSDWRSIPAGVPQGTKLGPWLYIVMINDLNISGVQLWKYVDDITMSESVEKNQPSKIQLAVDDLSNKSKANKSQLNETKCKELRIGFSKSDKVFDPVKVNDTDLELVDNVKLLGLNLSKDLRWNTHVSEIISKVATRLYFLRQLKRSRVASKELVLFYVTCVRPLTEYACQVYHNSLPNYLSEDLERLQKRAMRIIFPECSYAEALEKSGLQTLFKRRQVITEQFFNKIVTNQSHRLHSLLPETNVSRYNFRNNRRFVHPSCKTKRCQNSFINYNVVHSS